MARTQELFSIGDVAQLFHLSVSSLRHYETIGLLTPEYTDPATGYRYYGPRQFEVLNTIRYLRALDMPLGQIRAFLRNRDGGLLARDHDDRLRPDERPGKIRDRDPHPRHGGMKKTLSRKWDSVFVFWPWPPPPEKLDPPPPECWSLSRSILRRVVVVWV